MGVPERHTDAPDGAARLADEFLSSLPAPSGAGGTADAHDTREAAPARGEAEAARAPAAPGRRRSLCRRLWRGRRQLR